MLDRPIVPIGLGEKTAVWFESSPKGEPGHGGLPPQNQATVNLAALVTDIGGFGTPRVHPVLREQFALLASASSGPKAAIFRALASGAGSALSHALAPQLRKAGALGLLLSDSITPTVLSAGYKNNVVPGEARASFDSRLLPDADLDAFLKSMDAKASKRGGRLANVVQKGHGPVSSKGPLFDILTAASGQLNEVHHRGHCGARVAGRGAERGRAGLFGRSGLAQWYRSALRWRSQVHQPACRVDGQARRADPARPDAAPAT